MPHPFRPFALLALALSLTACALFENLAETERRTLSFAPAAQGVHHVRHNYTTGPCGFGLERRGTGTNILFFWQDRGGVDANGLLVGYGSTIGRGPDPFPCDLWVHHAFQGKAFFDLRDLPPGAIIERAQLTMVRDINPTPDIGDQTLPCTYFVGTAAGLSTAPYTAVRGPDQVIATRPTRPGNQLTRGTIDVTRTVATWLRDGTTDTWFVISPDPGRTFQEHSENDDRSQCHMHVDDLTLEITARVPPGP